MTVDLLKRGEPAVLDELLAEHGREIQAVAYLILRDRLEAEDVLMETLVTALDRGSSLREPGALRAWLLRIATNHALGRRRRTIRLVDLSVAPEARHDDRDAGDRLVLLQALETLPPRTRAAVVLRYYADLSVADVATAMGTSPNTVKTQLRQAMERLRATLTEPAIAETTLEVRHG